MQRTERISIHLRPKLRFFSLALFAAFTIVSACNRAPENPAAFPPSTSNDCLPNLTLTDQSGKPINLPSLKGKPALFDFIYTTCPGPCLTLTSRMKQVAKRIGPMLGTQVTFVSVTVDPEHDGPSQLLEYSKQQGADQPGWLFLSGPPADIERLMSQFNLKRQREADGTVDHVLEFFLVGPDGKQLYQYVASRADPDALANDLEQAAKNGAVSGSNSTSAHY